MEATTEKAISIEVLNQRENSLIALAASAKDLTITGPDDKAGYKAVQEKRKELKAERVSVENDAYDLRENAIKFQKTVIKREKQLVAIIAEEESRLSGLEDTYDQWQAEIKRKKDKEENERIQKRVDALSKFGYAIDFYEAKIMPDENYEALLGHAEAEWIKDQERIAAEKAEEERLKKEEEERLKLEREELAKQRAEQDAREKELQRQEAERLEIVRKQEEQFKRESERYRKEQEAIQAQIQADREKFESEKRKYEESVRLENARKEAAERARLDEQNKIKREAEEKEQRERKAKEEATRQEALKPDKEKLLAYAAGLSSIPTPILKDSECCEVLGYAIEKLTVVEQYIKDQVSKL
jgi:hypothetical protein